MVGDRTALRNALNALQKQSKQFLDELDEYERLERKNVEGLRSLDERAMIEAVNRAVNRISDLFILAQAKPMDMPLGPKTG